MHQRATEGVAMLIMACAVLALACHDVARPAKPNPVPPAVAARSMPVYEAVQCTVDVLARSVSCAMGGRPTALTSGPSVRADVIYDICCTYAYYWPANLVKDTVAQRWSFTMKLANLLGEPIGTLDGTTVTGVRLVLRDPPNTTGGSGTVTVANADGVDTFTAPDQPYWLYDQIIQPNQWSDPRTLAFHVPNTVASFNINLIMAAHMPAEQTVTAEPPDTVPAWVSADSNVSEATTALSGPFIKRIVRVEFKSTATLVDRQLAVALVGGSVIGGNRFPNGGGIYVVRIEDAGTGQQLVDATRKLNALPQVSGAGLGMILEPLYLRPDDGGDWKNWSLSPDSAAVTKQRWPLEMIDAPFAWGCSTGDTTTGIGVVDHGFRDPPDVYANVHRTPTYALDPSDTTTHGLLVTGILASQGDNGLGVSGVM